jgi:hypothetical protein
LWTQTQCRVYLSYLVTRSQILEALMIRPRHLTIKRTTSKGEILTFKVDITQHEMFDYLVVKVAWSSAWRDHDHSTYYAYAPSISHAFECIREAILAIAYPEAYEIKNLLLSNLGESRQESEPLTLADVNDDWRYYYEVRKYK